MYAKAKSSGRCAMCLRLPGWGAGCPCLETPAAARPPRRRDLIAAAAAVLVLLPGCQALDVRDPAVAVTVTVTFTPSK